MEKIASKTYTTPYGDGKFYLLPPKFNIAMGTSTLNSNEKHKLVHEYSDELVYCIDGKFLICIKDEQDMITKGDFILIPQNTEYIIYNPGKQPVKVLYIAYPKAPDSAKGHKYLK